MTKTRRHERPEVDSYVQPVAVITDYRRSPLLSGCIATVTADDELFVTVRGVDVHAALHLVMDELQRSCSAGAGVICGSGVAWLGVSA